MIKLILSASLSATVLLSPSGLDDPCKGCEVVNSNTVGLTQLQVTFPATMLKGDCELCDECGNCIPHPCFFDGQLELKNNNAFGGSPYYYRKNGQDGESVLNPQRNFTVTYFNEQIECGNVDVYGSWRYVAGGQIWNAPGEVKIGCSKCPDDGDGGGGGN